MNKKLKKPLLLLLCLLLIFQQSGFAQVAAVELKIAGCISSLHDVFIPDMFRPLHLRYLYYNSESNGFRLLLDKGDVKNLKDSTMEQATKELLHYFFVGVTLPNDSFWVNLRPDSPDTIIDHALARTEVGRILLEADLRLKKDTAFYTSPQTLEGREYWDKLYKRAGEIFGYDNISIPTLTRPWIVPDEIIIREAQDNAYIYKATLKVMLEQDYLKDSSVYNFKDERSKQLNEYSSQLIRDLIIPKLTKEINTSKRYAPLRQVYYSLILAQWFKQQFAGKNTGYSSLIDRRNLTGLVSTEDWSKTTYFQAYQKSFKDGEYNIKEPVYTPSGQIIRSYFSGGIALQQMPSQPLPAGGQVTDIPLYTKEALASGTPDNLSIKFEPPKGPPAASTGKDSIPAEAGPVVSGRAVAAKQRGSVNLVDYRDISPDNFKAFWDALDVQALILGRLKEDVPDDFLRDIKGLKAQKVALVIGPELIVEQLAEQGWDISDCSVRQDGRHKHPRYDLPVIYKISNSSGEVKYVVNGIYNNHNLHDFVGLLKANKYPFEKVSVIRHGEFNLRGYYRTVLAGKFTGAHYAIVALGDFQDKVEDRLRREGFVAVDYNNGRMFEYRVFEKNGYRVVVAQLLQMWSDSCAEFMDELHSQGIRDFVFWGTLGVFGGKTEYFEPIRVTKATQVYTEETVDAPSNAHFPMLSDGGGQTCTTLNEYSMLFNLAPYIHKLKKGIGNEAWGVEMEMVGLFRWLKQHQDANCDIYLNASDGKAIKPIDADFRVRRRVEVANQQADAIAKRIGQEGQNKGSSLEQGRVDVVASPLAENVRDPSAVSPLSLDKKGGIDFRFLPIVAQSMDSLKASIGAMPRNSLQRINLTQEWSDTERLVNSGIIPSEERLKGYFAASCFKGNLDSDMDKIVSCVSDILRMQEEASSATGSTLKDILIVLGSGKSGEELKTAFLME